MAWSQISTASEERIESVTIRTWCQIVSLRGSVLCSHITPRPRRARAGSLLDYIRSQFARFCTLYVGVSPRKRSARSVPTLGYSFLVFDFSAISRLSHFIGTSFGPPTAKSHRYWANEIAMWDGRSEISVGHQWRCRMSHSTSRQCTLVSIATLRSRVLAPQCMFYPILDTRFHIDASPHEESYSERCILQIFDQ